MFFSCWCKMMRIIIFIFSFPTLSLASIESNSLSHSQLLSAEQQYGKFSRKLSKPLIGYNGTIYACSGKELFAFEKNGSIVWTLNLNYTCNSDIAPVYGGRQKIYVIAENKVLKINLLNPKTSEPSAEVFLSSEIYKEGQGEIIGATVSTLSSSVFVNFRSRGLFAYTMRGQMLWSSGPVLDQFGYPQGCRKNVTDCYFSSVPLIDQCEASIYISNTEGEVYSLSLRSPHFKWIQDLSSFDKVFSIIPGNNGHLYVIVPVRALMLALDVLSGNVLWQGSIGPLSAPDIMPVVDSNGWISIGSLDGFVYTFSPDGALKKFSKVAASDSVVQVSPVLDCSGYAVYISQTETEGKISHSIGEYTYVASMRPISAVFTLFSPATGSIYWSESYPGKLSFPLSMSNLRHFILDERILLAFFAASNTGNPLTCQSTHEKLKSSCSKARVKHLNIYTGNERAIFLFLLFETAVLILLAILVRFCCIFWKKKKLKDQNLGTFLEKRRSLQLKKKSFDRTITVLQKRAAEEIVASEVLEELGSLVREREGIKRKLSTTYSLGRDIRSNSQSKPLLPLKDMKTRSYSFQNARKESVTIFHTLSDTSSKESSNDKETSWSSHEEELETITKAKVPIEVESSNDDEDGTSEIDLWRNLSPLKPTSSSSGTVNPLFEGKDWRDKKFHDDDVEVQHMQKNGSTSFSLKRRRALSSTN